MLKEIGEVQSTLNGRIGDVYEVYIASSMLHRFGYDTIQTIIDEATRGKICKEEAVDIIHMMDGAYDRLKKFISILDSNSQLLQKLVGVAWVQENLSNPDNAGYIQGKLAKGYPNVRAIPLLPKRTTDPEGFAALMTHLGIPETIWKERVVDIHWPGFCEYVTTLAENGLPVPPGIDPGSMHPRFSVSTRPVKGKELDEPSTLG